jgi:4-hydroxybenzoate polyprenyltransferase
VARWLKYLAERSPPAALLLIVGGVSLSGVWMGGARVRGGMLALVAGGLWLFLVVARLMDELKDHDKDRLAHPERPLPRGLIAVDEARRAVALGAAVGLGYAAMVALVAGPQAGALYAAAIAYLWLMYREFYLGAELQRRTVLYALSHQLVVFPLYAFAISVPSPAAALARPGLAYVLANVGASMAYEIARKLDLGAHPALRTYAAIFGPTRAALLAAVFCAVAAAGAHLLGLGRALGAVEALVVIALVAYVKDPRRHRAVESVAGLASLLFIWSVPVRELWRHFR